MTEGEQGRGRHEAKGGEGGKRDRQPEAKPGGEQDQH
jgi:hypothetical protein